MLSAHNIELIPLVLDNTTHEIVSKAGCKERPKGMTLPCMYIEEGNEGQGQWVHESLSIITYLEEVFGEKGQSILGATPTQRLKTTDIVSLFPDILLNYLAEIIHSVPGTTVWSHIEASEMSPGAAAHAGRRKKFYMARLEDWVRRDVVERGTVSLSGKGRNVTLADVVVMAQVCYCLDGQGVDWLEGCDVLKEWWQRAIKEDWWVSGEQLKACEGEDGWTAVLGE